MGVPHLVEEIATVLHGAELLLSGGILARSAKAVRPLGARFSGQIGSKTPLHSTGPARLLVQESSTVGPYAVSRLAFPGGRDKNASAASPAHDRL
jgi:hypothetical protein